MIKFQEKIETLPSDRQKIDVHPCRVTDEVDRQMSFSHDDLTISQNNSSPSNKHVDLLAVKSGCSSDHVCGDVEKEQQDFIQTDNYLSTSTKLVKDKPKLKKSNFKNTISFLLSKALDDETISDDECYSGISSLHESEKCILNSNSRSETHILHSNLDEMIHEKNKFNIEEIKLPLQDKHCLKSMSSVTYSNSDDGTYPLSETWRDQDSSDYDDATDITDLLDTDTSYSWYFNVDTHMESNNNNNNSNSLKNNDVKEHGKKEFSNKSIHEGHGKMYLQPLSDTNYKDSVGPSKHNTSSNSKYQKVTAEELRISVDGFNQILQKLMDIESKLDNIRCQEFSMMK